MKEFSALEHHVCDRTTVVSIPPPPIMCVIVCVVSTYERFFNFCSRFICPFIKSFHFPLALTDVEYGSKISDPFNFQF